MKKLLLILLCLPMIGLGQRWSNYYIDANVNVSGNINKTITTIDYGALANANAIRESNILTRQRIAIEQAQYRDAKERNDAIMDANRAIEIAHDPMKAHTYGYTYTSKFNHKDDGWEGFKKYGFLSYDEVWTVPHKSLFENVGKGRFENISSDGITTEIITSLSNYNYRNLPYLDYEQVDKYRARMLVLYEYYKNNEKPSRKNYRNKNEDYKKDLERYYEVCDSLDNFGFKLNPKSSAEAPYIKEKSMFATYDGDSAYCHKKEVVKRTVYGNTGFRSTLIWEDDYEICITDNYESSYNGITSTAKVRYKADKSSNITFEDLEGRRFYLSKFIDKTIAARIIKNEVYASEDKYKPKRRSYSNSEDYQKAFDKWNKKWLRK